MFEPVRGGTRGGQAEFKWSDVSQDKDRENYLGHSINAPTGRWQKNKDIHWYSRDSAHAEEERREEMRRIKEVEAEALAAALGFGPGTKGGSSSGAGTGANAIAVPVKTLTVDNSLDPEKEERRLLKAQKKEEKRLKKEKKRAERHRERGDVSGEGEDTQRRRRHSRSRSPRRRDHGRPVSPQHRINSYEEDRHARRGRSRSRTPLRRRTGADEYDEESRNREREMHRRQWDANAQRDRPGVRWGRG